uniref:PKD_channel domain-containing protein n=1 Tax=Heligmosomoides polygyrus TaxID=6339 RepID=A0A183G3A1_HELPZ
LLSYLGAIAEFLANFQSEVAVFAAYGYFFFTGVSVFVYIFEMIDVCQTLKYEEENVFYARLAKSLVLALEEVSSMHDLLHQLSAYLLFDLSFYLYFIICNSVKLQTK